MTKIPLLVVGILLLSGCAQTPSTQDPEKTTIDLDGVVIASDKALIDGSVVSDAGLPIPNVRISLLGTDEYINSDERGLFHFVNVTAGPVQLQAAHASFKTHVHPLTAVAGTRTTANLTMLPKDAVGTEFPHLHDHWAGEQTYLLFDAKINLQQPPAGSPYPAAYWAANTALVRPNVASNEAARWTVPIGKTPGGGPALVLPATDQMTVTLRWAGDTIRTEGIGFCYRDASYNPTQCLPVQTKSPATFQFAVDPATADSAHQPYSLWSMQIYVVPLNQGQGGLPDVMYGEVGAKIELRKGELLVDPPHPNFWADGNERVVLHDDYPSTGTSTSPPAIRNAKQIIPPGTTRVRMDHTWTVQGAAGDLPWEFRMRYRGASVDPYAEPSTWPTPNPTSGSMDDQHLIYEFAVDPNDADGYYQRSSYWRFSYFQPRTEGTGADTTGVPVRHVLIVTAIRDV